MKNDYQISDDGIIFQIKEDGSITKLGKIESGKIIPYSVDSRTENILPKSLKEQQEIDSRTGARILLVLLFIACILVFFIIALNS